DVVSYRSGPANWVDARRGITLRDRDERSSLAIHVCFLRETGSSTSTTRNMEETGVLEKVNLSGFCYLALNQVGRRSFPMEIVGKVAATIQNVLGPEAEELGRATGVIQRRRKFTAVSLLRMLVLTLLRKPDAKATDFQSTAAQLGLDVTSTAVENRFTPQLVGFLRAVLE